MDINNVMINFDEIKDKLVMQLNRTRIERLFFTSNNNIEVCFIKGKSNLFEASVIDYIVNDYNGNEDFNKIISIENLEYCKYIQIEKDRLLFQNKDLITIDNYDKKAMVFYYCNGNIYIYIRKFKYALKLLKFKLIDTSDTSFFFDQKIIKSLYNETFYKTFLIPQLLLSKLVFIKSDNIESYYYNQYDMYISKNLNNSDKINNFKEKYLQRCLNLKNILSSDIKTTIISLNDLDEFYLARSNFKFKNSELIHSIYNETDYNKILEQNFSKVYRPEL